MVAGDRLQAVPELVLEADAGLAVIELDRSDDQTAEEAAKESVAYCRDTLGLVLTPEQFKDSPALSEPFWVFMDIWQEIQAINAAGVTQAQLDQLQQAIDSQDDAIQAS